jgi:hypothetical protein
MIPWKFRKNWLNTDLENWFWKFRKNTDFWKSKKKFDPNGKSDNLFFCIFWTLGSLGLQGWVRTGNFVKKCENHCTLVYVYYNMDFCDIPASSFPFKFSRIIWCAQSHFTEVCATEIFIYNLLTISTDKIHCRYEAPREEPREAHGYLALGCDGYMVAFSFDVDRQLHCGKV